MCFERWESSEPELHSQQPSDRVVLVADERAPGTARHAVRALAQGFDPDCRDNAELLVTETVTNAVLHANGAAVEVCFWVRAGMLDVLVIDGGRGFVARRPAPDARARGGLGLPLVDTLALRWGSSAAAPGAVWFQLATYSGLRSV